MSNSVFQDCSNLSELTIQVKLDKPIATYRTPYGIDFSIAVSGLKAYTVPEVKDGKAVLQEVTSKVPAGTGLILKGTAGETYDLNGDIPLDGVKPEPNLLVGEYIEPVIGENGMDYILKDGKFVKAAFSHLKAGKAYLKLDAALAREVIEIAGDATGIDALQNNKEESIKNNEVYNLNGQRISKPAKGVYVVDGKKVMVK
jgi:hypothetical protein